MAKTAASRSQEIIENIGFGRAQLIILALGAGGVFFCDGVVLIVFGCIAGSVVSDLGLDSSHRSLMATSTYLGLFVGASLGGYFGDKLGRRFAILTCYACVTIGCFLAALAPHYSLVLAGAAVAGWGAGFGMSPSIAMASENTPAGARLLVRTSQSCIYTVGAILVYAFAALNDVTLTHLNWRWMLCLSGVPPACWFIAALMFLHESPVHLATTGRRAEALREFCLLARRNGHVDIENLGLEFAEAGHETSPAPSTLSLASCLSIIFSAQLRYSTIVLAFAAFCGNMGLYGLNYANALVLPGASFFPAAWQMLFNQIPVLLVIILMMYSHDKLLRKTVIMSCFATFAATSIAIAIAGKHPAPRPVPVEVLFQSAILLVITGPGVSLIPIYQLAVDIFPANIAATGCSVIIGLGRLGAVMGPQAFESIQAMFGYWEGFYSALGLLSIVILMLVPFVYSPDDKPAVLSKGIQSETYGSVDAKLP